MNDTHVLREPGAIRALAYPLRIRLLSVLQVEGPATATTLSKVLIDCAESGRVFFGWEDRMLGNVRALVAVDSIAVELATARKGRCRS